MFKHKGSDRAISSVLVISGIVLLIVVGGSVIYFANISDGDSSISENKTPTEEVLLSTSTDITTAKRTQNVVSDAGSTDASATPTKSQDPTTEVKETATQTRSPQPTVIDTATGTPTPVPAPSPTTTPTLTPTTTPTPTPTTTPTLTATPTPTQTPTPTPNSSEDEIETPERYFTFLNTYYGISVDRATQEYELMGVYVDPNGTMWNVVNGTEPKAKPQIVEPVWRNIAVLYARAWTAIEQAEESYARPERMRVVEFNNSIVDGNSSTFVVKNEDVRALHNGSISKSDYTSNWFRRTRKATNLEVLEAEGIAGNTTNTTVPKSARSESLLQPEQSETSISNPGELLPEPLQYRAKPAS